MEMLREMAVFVRVVDAGSFSAAARQLGLTTSAVSRHVNRLETQMGARLLQRTTRSLALTELGQQVHAASTRMLASAREVEALAGSYGSRPTGTIRVTAPVVLGQAWLAPRLPGFLARYPEVDVHLSLVERNVDLVDESIDLAIRISRALAPGLAARPLFPMRYVLVAAPSYLAARGAPATPGDLATHSCIYLGHNGLGERWTLERGGEAVSVSVAARLVIDNSSAIMAVVQAGSGIGLVPDFAAREALARGSAVPVLPGWTVGEPYSGTVYAAYIPGRHLALKIRALIDYLVEANPVSF